MTAEVKINSHGLFSGQQDHEAQPWSLAQTLLSNIEDAKGPHNCLGVSCFIELSRLLLGFAMRTWLTVHSAM